MEESKVDILKEKINNMSHYELAQLWRHGSSDNELFHGEVGSYFKERLFEHFGGFKSCLLYTSPSPRDRQKSRMPSSA